MCPELPRAGSPSDGPSSPPVRPTLQLRRCLLAEARALVAAPCPHQALASPDVLGRPQDHGEGPRGRCGPSPLGYAGRPPVLRKAPLALGPRPAMAHRRGLSHLFSKLGTHSVYDRQPARSLCPHVAQHPTLFPELGTLRPRLLAGPATNKSRRTPGRNSRAWAGSARMRWFHQGPPGLSPQGWHYVWPWSGATSSEG